MFPVRLRSAFFQSVRSYSSVKIVEVGPRDGLQNEQTIIPTSTKVDFINRLSKTGLRSIEVTSFVSPKWVPQMADQKQVFHDIQKHSNISYPVLVPNLKGLEQAIESNVKEIAIFGSASESFAQKNTNCSIKESIKRYTEVAEKAKQHSMKIRGYVSCVVGCPYEGEIKPSATAIIAENMLDLGCYEISLGDTIGVGTPLKIRHLLKQLRSLTSNDMTKFALHCHDTYGQAIANIYEGLENGITTFDSSVAGLGGCPYAAGASGNVATEDLLYFLHGQNCETGIDLDAVVEIGDFICKQLSRENGSKVAKAMLAKKRKQK